MIKVCHVTSAHNSADTRVFHKECVSLAKAGYDVTLIAPGEDREEQGVHVVGLGEKPQGTMNRLRSGLPKRACLRALALDADIYHLHDPELLPYALRLKRAGKKVIFDSHEFYAQLMSEKVFIPKPLRALASGAYKLLETHVLRRIDAVVTPCTLQGRNVFEGRAKRTVYVDNLPMADRFLPPETPAQPTKNAVGYVGSITRTRGMETLIRAADRAGVRLCLAGPVWPAFHDELKAMPEYRCVDYVGRIPYEEVPDFCRTLCVGMCTLQNTNQYVLLDNLPTKVYEYLGCGIPVILSNTAAAKRFIEKYECGLCVDPSDADEIAAAIKELLSDGDRARIMGENGRRAVLENYNWSTQERNLRELYEELCEEAKL